VIRSVLCGVIANGGEEEPNGDTPLIETDDGTSDPLGGALGLIHWGQGGDQADTETGNDPTNDKKRKRGCRGLESDADREDET
jgi:hypothetical protein